MRLTVTVPLADDLVDVDFTFPGAWRALHRGDRRLWAHLAAHRDLDAIAAYELAWNACRAALGDPNDD